MIRESILKINTCSYDTYIVIYHLQEEGEGYIPGCKEGDWQGQDEEVVEEGRKDVENRT